MTSQVAAERDVVGVAGCRRHLGVSLDARSDPDREGGEGDTLSRYSREQRCPVSPLPGGAPGGERRPWDSLVEGLDARLRRLCFIGSVISISEGLGRQSSETPNGFLKCYVC